jgi:O-antigen biosynthesis protein
MDLKKIKLGIIILTLDLLPMLQSLVKSIFEYTTGDFQIYIVENGQKKETIKWLKTQNVKTILHETNKGITPSWNDGLKAAVVDDCTHFAILEDDIEISPGWWDACKKEFENGSHLVSVDAGLKHIIFSGWFFIIDKEALDKIGYMDEQFVPFYFEDLDYSQRFEQSGLKYSMANTKVIHHGSMTIVKNIQKNNPTYFTKVYRANKKRFRAKYPHLTFRM